MIDRAEIFSVANATGLQPQVVEKDYILGWLLAGIFRHPELRDGWIFKGGTCLKKCYFETYRFSEDLDFTLRDEVQLNEDFLKKCFAEIAGWVYEESGIEIPAERMRFDIHSNPRGRLSCEGRIYYRSQFHQTGQESNLPGIRLDLTADEAIVLEPAQRPVSHPYTDIPEEGFTARCYAYEEVFGEKIRALAERVRPRDLYDVVNLYRHTEFRPDASAIADVVRQKCEFKGIPFPQAESLESSRDSLAASWQSMLAHQLPELPAFEPFWAQLPELFRWLVTREEIALPATISASEGEEVLRPSFGRLDVGIGGGRILESIRFAAGNRLCVDLHYDNSVRRIEPYSLRRTSEGNVLLYAVRTSTGEIRAYRVDRIQGAKVTQQTFTPRYAVELSPSQPLRTPPTSSIESSALPRLGTPRRSSSSGSRRATSGIGRGPTHVFECLLCGKKFRKKKFSGLLNPHKDKSGFPCHGRIGHHVETKY